MPVCTECEVEYTNGIHDCSDSDRIEVLERDRTRLAKYVSLMTFKWPKETSCVDCFPADNAGKVYRCTVHLAILIEKSEPGRMFSFNDLTERAERVEASLKGSPSSGQNAGAGGRLASIAYPVQANEYVDLTCPECGEMLTDHVIVTRHAAGLASGCDESFTGPSLPSPRHPAHDWKAIADGLMLAMQTGEELAAVRKNFGLHEAPTSPKIKAGDHVVLGNGVECLAPAGTVGEVEKVFKGSGNLHVIFDNYPGVVVPPSKVRPLAAYETLEAPTCGARVQDPHGEWFVCQRPAGHADHERTCF